MCLLISKPVKIIFLSTIYLFLLTEIKANNINLLKDYRLINKSLNLGYEFSVKNRYNELVNSN